MKPFKDMQKDAELMTELRGRIEGSDVRNIMQAATTRRAEKVFLEAAKRQLANGKLEAANVTK